MISKEWDFEDYVKYHVERIEQMLYDLSFIGLNEASMRLDGQLTYKLHLALIEDRCKGMEECISEVKQLKERLLT